jgi:hypothetical protein
MTTAAITMAEELGQFTKQYADSHHCLELLRFFGRYPHAQFSELAVVHALNLNREKQSTKRVLRQLVDKGVLRISICNNTSLYSLTEDESLCRLASHLVKFNWRQWQLMLRQTLPAPGEEVTCQ